MVISIRGRRARYLPAQAAESSTKKPSRSIGNCTLTSLSGYQAATMLAACWMLWASTDTLKWAVPLHTSTETFTIWLTFLQLACLNAGLYVQLVTSDSDLPRTGDDEEGTPTCGNIPNYQ